MHLFRLFSPPVARNRVEMVGIIYVNRQQSCFSLFFKPLMFLEPDLVQNSLTLGSNYHHDPY